MNGNDARVIQFALMCGTFLTAWGLLLYSFRRRPKPDASVSNDITLRLERIEQAVETIAIEVERVSEGQRFTSKLLADASPRMPAKQITPH